MSGGHGHLLQFPPRPLPMDRRWKPNIEVAPNCPRCASSNTKFCYYNNYSLSQPRYFCKGCRRYWTKGGSLRNVPVGGGCRKNRRGKSVRHPQPETERVSINYSRNSGYDSTITDSGNIDQPNKTGGSDIDLAVVFAKFLNQNPTSGRELDNEANGSSNLSNSLTPESVETDHNDPNFEFQKLSDPIIDCDTMLREDLNAMELRSLLGDDDQVGPDILCSDGNYTTSSLSNFTWQPPMMQLQDSEYSIPLDNGDYDERLQINSTVNIINDGWSSFDLSTLDCFPRL